MDRTRTQCCSDRPGPVVRPWILLLSLVAPGLVLTGYAEEPAAGTALATDPASERTGRVVSIGGALSGENEAVYQTALEGREGTGPICVIPTAGADPQRSMDSAVESFRRWGGGEAARGVLLGSEEPERALDPVVAEELRECGGFFFTGGSQSRIAETFRPEGESTPAYEAVMERFRQGAVVSGTSAGAAMMSDPMIAGGDSEGAFQEGVGSEGGVRLDRGLEFLPELLVDQHFLARGRIGRLIVATLSDPQGRLGVGVDENTALVVEEGRAWVVGASGVLLVDAAGAVAGSGSPADVQGLRIELMGAGDTLDLESREVTAGSGKEPVSDLQSASSAHWERGSEDPDDLFGRWTLLHLLYRMGVEGSDPVRIRSASHTVHLRPGDGFRAVASSEEGVEGTPHGLSMGPVQVDIRPENLEAGHPDKSIAFYVGRNLTGDGSVLLGGFGHEPSSHWLEITPGRDFPEGTMVEVGVTESARYPGERTRIPQVSRTARFITSNYSEFAGFPPPLTNGGLNEHGVAARTVWSPSRAELREMTPDPQRGLSYSDLARAVMERARSAREAVRIVGDLVEAHGYATYGGNSFLFADAEEGWVVLTFAGGQGLWAAERLGPDQVRVLYPGFIRDFPVGFEEDPDFMGSPHLVRFAQEQDWFEPDASGSMDLQQVYGQPFPSLPGDDDAVFQYPPDREEELLGLTPVSLADMMALVRDPRWSGDRAGYGQVAHLTREDAGDPGVLWTAVAPSAATPMTPLFVEVDDVPPEYKQHRYMTKDADATFLDPGFASLEATRSAYRVHRRLLYHMCGHPEEFLPAVTAELEALEARRMAELPALRAEAERRRNSQGPSAARDYLTEQTDRWLHEALTLTEALVEVVEAQVKDRFGIAMPQEPVPEGATWRTESGPSSLRGGSERIHCYRPGLDRYPRRHGSYSDLRGTLLP